MKTLILTLVVTFASTALFAQKISFREADYDNGMKYPIVQFPSNTAVQVEINRDIEELVEGFKSQDFCIGQYGYVQKSGFLQIHIYANCIEMTSSENYYTLYDLETGKVVSISKMFKSKSMSEFNTYFREKARAFVKEKSIPVADTVFNTMTIDDFHPVLTGDGIELKHASIESWGENKLIIKWTDIQKYLKLSYI